MAIPSDGVLTAEAAEILDRSIATVNRLAANGRLKVAMKLAGPRGANVYLRADVEALRDELVAKAAS